MSIKNRTCADCGKPIWSTSFRCHHCAKLGSLAHNWKGGHKKEKYKQISAPGHPHVGTNGCVKEHRIVMEKHLGRFLLPTEIVHHINGDTFDNRIENLMVFPGVVEHLDYHRQSAERAPAGHEKETP